MIERIIHQIWLGPERPPTRLMETWRRMHPDWDYRLWTEASLPQDFKNQHLIDGERSYSAKSDYTGYELLHRFGGVYTASDSYYPRPVDDPCGVEAFAVRTIETSVTGRA